VQQGAERVCSLAGGRFMDVPVLGVEATLRAERLVRVVMRLEHVYYPALRTRLRSRLGVPEDRSFRARAGMAGEFEAKVELWESADFAAILEEYAGKIDRGSLTFGDREAMQAALAACRAYPPGALRDL
jgi:hypothetical protein